MFVHIQCRLLVLFLSAVSPGSPGPAGEWGRVLPDPGGGEGHSREPGLGLEEDIHAGSSLPQPLAGESRNQIMTQA